MEDIISEKKILFRKPDGQEFISSIIIGRPFRKSEIEWCCDVEIPYVDKKRSSYGIDSLQSLINTISLAQSIIVNRIINGWQIFWPDNKRPTTPEEIFGFDFSPAMRTARGKFRGHLT